MIPTDPTFLALSGIGLLAGLWVHIVRNNAFAPPASARDADAPA